MNKYFAKGLLDRWKGKTELRKLKSMNNKPLSKEEILDGLRSYQLPYSDTSGYNRWDVMKVMDEYARQETIGFGEFIYEHCYKMPDGRFIIIPQFNRNTDTPDYNLLELYEKYLESKTREKEK